MAIQELPFGLGISYRSFFIAQAGVGSPENPEQLIIALEPEAAAIFCQEKNMSDFQGENGSRSVDEILSQLNTRYMAAAALGELTGFIFQKPG